MKRLLGVIAVAVAALAAVLGVRAASMRSLQPAAEKADLVPVDAAAAAGRLAAALRFRTISHADPARSDGAAFKGLREHLERSFPQVHAKLEREVVGTDALLYTWRGSSTSTKPILLMAHMDVVPVEPGTETSWTHPAFEGRIADGFLWGRGAMDFKVGVLGLLEAAEILIGQGFAPARTIYLAFGDDEEGGGRGGAQKIAALLQSRGVRLESVLDEGSAIVRGVPGVDAPVALVGIAEKGYLSIEMRSRADGGHSSMPPPQTAVGILAAAVRRLEENPLPARLTGAARGLFEHLGPEMGFGSRVVFANLWLFAPAVERKLAAKPATNALIRTTTAATMFEAGVKDNVLPSKARAVVNFRILPGDSVAGVLEHVRRTIDDPRVEVAALDGPAEPAPLASAESEAFRRIGRTVKQVFPEALVAPSLVVAITDSRWFVPLADGVYRFFPLTVTQDDLKRIHSTDERIGVEDYARAVRFYARLMLNAAGPPPSPRGGS